MTDLTRSELIAALNRLDDMMRTGIPDALGEDGVYSETIIGRAARLLADEVDPARDYLNQPGVWITPARQGGSPCIIGTRITLSCVENYLWDGHPLEELTDGYNLTRAQVLCAAWVAGRHGLVHHHKARKPWAAWAVANDVKAWDGRWDDMPLPPTKEQA